MQKTCGWCHGSFDSKSFRVRFCTKSCGYEYQKMRYNIMSLYLDDSKRYSDELLRFMKEGKDYKLREAND